MKRRPPRRRLDVATMVAVAAAANRTDPELLAARSDLTVLALVGERTTAAATPAEAAAAVLVGVAAGRPFPDGNGLAAWALAATAVERRGLRLHAATGPAVELVRASSAGKMDEARVAEQLLPWIVRRDRTRDALRWLFSVPPGPGPVDWACPRCGRPVSAVPFRSSPCLREPLPADVVADCAARWRAHVGGTDVPAEPVVRYEPPVAVAT